MTRRVLESVLKLCRNVSGIARTGTNKSSGTIRADSYAQNRMQNIVARNEEEAVPIVALPTELLQMIFMFYTELLFKSHKNCDVIRSLLSITHVCARFRSVAVSFPQMWFPVCCCEWDAWKIADLFMERGISFRLSNRNDHRFHLPPGLPSRIDRLEDINLGLDTEQLEHFFATGTTFPSLISLQLRNSRGWMMHDMPTNKALHLIAPKVQYLNVAFVQISSLAVGFKNLSELTLDRLCVSMTDIVTVLSNSVDIRRFKLSSLEVVDVVDPLHSDLMPIKFRDLQDIEFFLEEQYLIPFFSLVSASTSPSTRISIGLFKTMDNLGSFCRIFSRTISTFLEPGASFCRTSSDLHFGPLSTSRGGIKFRTDWTSMKRGSCYLPRIATSLDLPRISHLSMTADDPNFLDYLDLVPDVERLALMSVIVEQDIRAFGPPSQHYPSSTLLCPFLQELRIVYQTSMDSFCLAPVWYDTIKSRKEHGDDRLQVITFFVPDPKSFNPSVASRFRGIVDEFDVVHWRPSARCAWDQWQDEWM